MPRHELYNRASRKELAAGAMRLFTETPALNNVATGFGQISPLSAMSLATDFSVFKMIFLRARKEVSS